MSIFFVKKIVIYTHNLFQVLMRCICKDEGYSLSLPSIFFLFLSLCLFVSSDFIIGKAGPKLIATRNSSSPLCNPATAHWHVFESIYAKNHLVLQSFK